MRVITGRLIGRSLFVFLFAGALAELHADLILTPAGVAEGLSLTTFATGFPNSSSVGPLGVAFELGGTVLVTDDPGNIRVFPSDTDGQTAVPGQVTQNYGLSNAVDLAQVGGSTYMTRQGTGDLVQVNNDGTFNQVIVSGMPAATGLAADPVTGHLFVSTLGNNAIWDVDPIAKTKTLFVAASADGLTLSNDGSILYGEVNGHILGWNTTTHAQVFDSGFISGADGAAAGTGSFAGLLFVNTNFGQVFEVNESTLAQTLIASGGTRGDFVTVDPTNDTLLITQTDRLIRLSGASFTTTTPEPSYLWLLVGGIAALPVFRWRRAVRQS